MYLRFLILAFILKGCSVTPFLVDSYVPTVFPETGLPKEKVLLLNGYDVVAQSYRENKEQLYIRIIDSILSVAAEDIRLRTAFETTVVPGFTKTDFGVHRDSVVRNMMHQHSTTRAIVVTSFDTYFNQTEVEVTKTESGKERQAFYDIVSRISFAYYDGNGFSKDKEVVEQRYHSSRNVLSGLLAAGPNIVKNQDYAFDLAHFNVNQYLDHFFPARQRCQRPLLPALSLVRLVRPWQRTTTL